MAKKTVGMSVTEETRERFLSLFPDTLMSGEDKLLCLLDAYENCNNSAETNIETNPVFVELKTAYGNLERENTAYIQAMAELRNEYNHLNSQVNYHNDMIKGKTGHVVLQISPAQTELLALVKERLEKHYKRAITNEDILLTPFFRYNFQQWTHWFYDFVVSPNEVNEICKRNGMEV